jgi:hypothetical protein
MISSCYCHDVHTSTSSSSSSSCWKFVIEIHCCCYTVELWRKNKKNAFSMIFFSKARSHLLSMMNFSKARSHASIVDDLVERDTHRETQKETDTDTDTEGGTSHLLSMIFFCFSKGRSHLLSILLFFFSKVGSVAYVVDHLLFFSKAHLHLTSNRANLYPASFCWSSWWASEVWNSFFSGSFFCKKMKMLDNNMNCSFSQSSYNSFRSSSVNRRRRRRLQRLSLGLFPCLFLTKNRSQTSEWRRFTRSRYMHLLLREGCAGMFWGEGSFYIPPPWPRRLQRCWSGDDGYLGKDFPATLEMGRIPTIL